MGTSAGCSSGKVAVNNGSGGLKAVILLACGALIIGVAIVGWRKFGRTEAPPVKADSGALGRIVSTPRRVRTQLDTFAVQQAIHAFQATEGRLPRNLDEINTADAPIPPAPAGYTYVYDANTGLVSIEKIESSFHEDR